MSASVALPAMDVLVDRCETMGWGYEVACWVDYVERIDGRKRAAGRVCRAEVTEPNGTTLTIDDATTGRDALRRAVTGMERVLARRATVGGRDEG